MKKEARDEALKMFIKAKGMITNKEISDAVQVNALTVGRWKRYDKWEEKLKEQKRPVKREPGVVRKVAARDKALSLFLEMGGIITNKELGRRVDVSPATISKWKEQDHWNDKIIPVPPEPEELPPIEVKEEPELDLGELASPEQIIRINDRIEGLLKREYLTAAEVAELAAAKRDMLDAVEIYVAIARGLGVIKE